MPKETITETLVEPVDIALDNWIESKSREVGRRVEALNAFYRLSQRGGKGRATAEEWEADFQKFLNSPA
jgi:hypothetical protein